MKKPIVINIHNLVENLSVTDSAQGRQELEDKITESLNKVISNATNIKKSSGKSQAIEAYYNSIKKSQHQAHLERIDLGDQMLKLIQKRKLESQTLLQDAQQFLDNSPKGLFLKRLLEFVTS